jgi:hemoglobin
MCQHAARPDAPPATAVAATPGRPACSLQQALTPSDELRWVGAGHDLDFPPVPFPTRRVLQRAGEATLRTLVARQHQRLLATPIAHLFPRDPAGFAQAIQRSADFVVQACGGSDDYTHRRGATCMRTRHLPFTIDEAGREHWLMALWWAFDDVAFPADVREELWNWLEAMSIRMVNRRTQRAQPERLGWDHMLAAAHAVTPAAADGPSPAHTPPPQATPAPGWAPPWAPAWAQP